MVTEITTTSPDASPKSLQLYLPVSIATAIDDCIFQRPELFDKDEHRLYKHLRSLEKTPSPTDNRLRLKFWTEYDRAMGNSDKKMNFVTVVAGVCSKQYFYETFLKHPEKVAWLICVPTGYLAKASEALEFGLEQLRDILEQSHVNANGKVDAALGTLKAKIVQMLDNRVNGAVAQKMLNLNVHTSDQKVVEAATASTMEELKRQYKELERRNRIAQNIPLPLEERRPDDRPVIDVDPS